jgi:hypothetical protein
MGRKTEDSQYMGAGKETGGAQERIAFVSRRKQHGDEPQGGSLDTPNPALPGLLQTRTLLLLALTVLLQALAWSELRGYQLADSVEFMDRAYAVARSDRLDTTGAVRGFGFSTFLLPFFWLAEVLEIENMRRVVHAIRVLQMTFGVGLVYLCVRLGARLGGRRVGYFAGYLVAINPIFLQYSVDPVSGVAAAFFVALGLDLLLEPGGFRRALLGGLAMGVAFMMAYQTLLIGVTLVALLVVRDRRQHAGVWIGALSGLSLAVIGQVALDRITYGSWGLSVWTYVIENSGGVFFSMVSVLGLEHEAWVREAYESYVTTINEAATVAEGELDLDGERRSLQSPFFYLVEMPSMLVWPVLVIGVLGLWRAWRELQWKSSLLLILILVNAYAMSMKGSKSFRLWLPILPMIAPLCAWGWGSLVRVGSREPLAWWRRVASMAVALGGISMGLYALYQLNTRRYGTYWDAIDHVSSQAHMDRLRLEESGEEYERQTVGAAYNWAVFCRSSSDVRVVKFNAHIDQWLVLTPEQREAVVTQMSELDWLVVHGTILRLSPDLAKAINERFEVIANFWDEDTDPGIRDVVVLRNFTERNEARTLAHDRHSKRLFESITGVDPAVYRESWQLDRSMRQPALLLGQGLDGREERLILLGFEYEKLSDTGFGWITYHWYTDTGFDRDYVLVDRVTILQCPWAWQNNRHPGYGALPTSSWEPGTIVREGYVMMPGRDPFGAGFKPFGGAYRRGDLLPAMLWIHGENPPPNIDEHMLLPADWETGALVDIDAGVPWTSPGLLTREGIVVSRDKLLQVARFLVPVNERYRWPDDGGPGPDDAILLEAFERQQLLQKERERERERERQANDQGQPEPGEEDSQPEPGEENPASGSSGN